MEQILDQLHRIWYQLVPSLQFCHHHTLSLYPVQEQFILFKIKLNTPYQRRHQIGRLICVKFLCEVIVACVEDIGAREDVLGCSGL